MTSIIFCVVLLVCELSSIFVFQSSSSLVARISVSDGVKSSDTITGSKSGEFQNLLLLLDKLETETSGALTHLGSDDSVLLAMEFRLLLQAKDPLPRQSIELEDRQWMLSESLNIDQDDQVPPFACVSYRWGSNREPNTLFENSTMSTHTLPSLAAAIRVSKCNAFWTDVFCVPRNGPGRQPTLENMGYIYTRAAEVIVVLREETLSVIQGMLQYGSVSESDLHILETDDWVSSVWTYQEIVNGGFVRFVSEQRNSLNMSIECADFFNALGFSLRKWQKSTNSNSFAALKAFPNLNILEIILADWYIGAPVSRSALSVFSSMSQKLNEDPANYYYAILGTLTDSPRQLKWHAEENLDEKLMSICEQKGDYSFIYTMAARDVDSERPWRPKPVSLPSIIHGAPPLLRPVFSWHSFGEAQDGHYDAAGFWLHGMTIMELSATISEAGKIAASNWLSEPELQHADDATLGSAVYEAVRGAGFEGESIPIMVTGGYVFPSTSIDGLTVRSVFVSNQIRWLMGAPGLVQACRGGRIYYIPCSYIGSTEQLMGGGESVLLLAE